MQLIYLTQGQVSVVDDDDYDSLSQYNWYAWRCNPTLIYALRAEWNDGKQRWIRMHRVILGVEDSKIKVDHINGNGLDNRRSNIRLCAHSENMRNQKKRSNNSSGFKGVSFNKRNQNWVAYICTDGKIKHLGCFPSATEAAFAYDIAAVEMHGIYARTNFRPCAATT